MDRENLLLEVGAQALEDLSTDEEDAILDKYENGQETLAGLHVFSLLSKKFKHDYRMGRMYQYESQKYKAYTRIYHEYLATIKAGKYKKQEDSYDVGRRFQKVNYD